MDSGVRARRKAAKKERCWRRRIARWQEAGMPIRAYCREHRLAVSTFGWWRREIKRRDSATEQMRPTGVTGIGSGNGRALFLPVKVKESAYRGDNARSLHEDGVETAIEISVGGGRTIRVRSGFDGEALARVLFIMEGAGC